MAGDGGFQPLVAIDMDIGTFGQSWTHCDRLSTYLARMVSHNRTDSLLYSNLFSSAINELLETVYRTHAEENPSGLFHCSILRNGPVDRIELTIPCDSDQAEFYRSALVMTNSDDAAEQYRDALFASGPLDPRIGLLELAVDYAARLSVQAEGDGAIRLAADLALEEEVGQ